VNDPAETARRIIASFPAEALFDTGTAPVPVTASVTAGAAASATAAAPHRFSPEPFLLPPSIAGELERQGVLWLKFLKALNSLYLASTRGDAPAFVAEYLDAGKPRRVVDFSRMNRFRSQYPMVLRPDLLLTDEGLAACELDSIPGGIGLTAALNRAYAAEGFAPVGGAEGMERGFAAALAASAGKPSPALAVVVSDESRMYRPEMRYLCRRLNELGGSARCVDPGQVTTGPEGITVAGGRDAARPDVVYRFFELFDLPNVPGGEAILEAAKLKRVLLTPPPKAHLEEKLSFALLHHPVLAPEWERELGAADFAALKAIVIPTWVMDPRPLPPHASIAGFTAAGRAVQSWEALGALSQRERAFVIKPSGFSALAWGSHGVRFGGDMPQTEWKEAVREALGSFASGPQVIQPWRRASISAVRYWDPVREEVRTMEGRVRLCPYYFVTSPERTVLGGVLATICPADKKAIHGMPDAIMVPCVYDAGRG